MSDSLIGHGSQALRRRGGHAFFRGLRLGGPFSDARWSALHNAIGSGPTVGSCGVGEFFLAVL